MSAPRSSYIGRFAPSPTGPLHFGSLLAAVASSLQAKVHGGRWLLRIEDIDPPREQQGAADEIIRALEAYGFAWDGPVLYQKPNLARHRDVVARLIADGHAYRCSCSRQDLSSAAQGPLGPIYPGTCRGGRHRPGTFSIRVRTHNEPISYEDLIQGPQSQQLESESGDFVIQRRDRLIAYHLAVVVDDFDQEVTEIVRGVDLLDSTPRQIHLQRLLGYSTPAYAHIPVAVNASGQKLSKMTRAEAIPLKGQHRVLFAALQALGQRPPSVLENSSLEEIWQWATQHWDIAALRGQRTVPVSQVEDS